MTDSQSMKEARELVRAYRNRQRGLPDSYGAPEGTGTPVDSAYLGKGGLNPNGDWSPIDGAIELDASTPVWLAL